MEGKDKQSELRDVIARTEGYKRQLGEMASQMQMVNAALDEIDITSDALDSLKENKKGTEILVPIGSGSYAKAELKDNEKVLINLGANISAEKTIADAKKILEAKKEKLNAARKKIGETAAELENKLAELNEVGEGLVREMQAKK